MALLKPSIDVVKLNAWTLVLGLFIPLGVLVGLLVFLGIGLAFSHSSKAATASILVIGLVALLAFIVVMVLLAPFATEVFLAGAQGRKVGVGEAYRSSIKHAGRFLVTGILTGLAILGGLILLIIPGLIFAIWFSLAPYYVVSEGAGAIDAMKKSKALVNGHFLEMAGVLAFGSAVGILGVIPLIGPLASIIISLLYSGATAIRFLQLKALKESGQPAPPAHWANWVVLILALVAPGLRAATAPKIQTPNSYHFPTDGHPATNP